MSIAGALFDPFLEREDDGGRAYFWTLLTTL